MILSHIERGEWELVTGEVLLRELGIVGMIRFLQQFETGYGDYSRDRHRWLDQQDLETILKRIREKREVKQGSS